MRLAIKRFLNDDPPLPALAFGLGFNLGLMVACLAWSLLR